MSHMFTGSMDWESSEVSGEPVSTAEFSVESISGDDSEDSTDSSVSEVDDISYDSGDSDEETDESANLIDDCSDNIITDTSVEDLESQNSFDAVYKEMIDRLKAKLPESVDDLESQKSFDGAYKEILDRLAVQLQDSDDQKILDAEIQELESQNFLDAQVRDLKDRITAEIQDIHIVRGSLNVIGDALDKKINETPAMVVEDDTIEEDELSLSESLLADYAAGELEESDSEMQVSAHVDFTEEQQLNWTAEERLFHSLFLAENEISEDSISGYGIYQADSDPVIPMEINGLGPKQTSLHKILDWMVTCRFEMSSYFDLITY